MQNFTPQIFLKIEKLRESIQTLCRSANPLGKIMDYIQVRNLSMLQSHKFLAIINQNFATLDFLNPYYEYTAVCTVQ
jgi:hypothetical protein